MNHQDNEENSFTAALGCIFIAVTAIITLALYCLPFLLLAMAVKVLFFS